MGKNTTKGDKKIVLQDQLYEEILNGFEETPGSVDVKSVQLKTIYKNRVKNVSESFFANVQTHQFLKTWAGNLSGTSVMDEMLEKLIGIKQQTQEDLEEAELDADEEYLQNDYDEKREKTIFDVLSILKWMRYVHIVRDLYNTYQRYEQIKGEIKEEWNENFSGIVDNDALSVSLRTSLCLHKIEGLFNIISFSVSTKAGEKLKKYIEENKKINGLFDFLEDALFDEIKHGVYHAAAVQAAAWGASLMPEGTISKLVAGGLWVYRGYIWLETASLLAEVARDGLGTVARRMAIEWFRENWDIESSKDFRDEIKENLSGLVYTAIEIQKQLDDLDKSTYDKLNVNQFINGQVQSFGNNLKDDISFIGKVANNISHRTRAGAGFNSNLQKPTIKLDLSQTTFDDDQDIKYILKLHEKIEGTIIDQIKRTHELRFNFVISDESYENLYGDTIMVEGKEMTTGLFALFVLQKWKNNLIQSGECFYSQFQNHINYVNECHKKSVDDTIKEVDKLLKAFYDKYGADFFKKYGIKKTLEIKDFLSYEVKQQNEQKESLNQFVDYETILRTPIKNDDIQGKDATVQPIISTDNKKPKSTIKGLRLYDKTLQPIHAIIGSNGTLTGLELRLLDSEDKQVEIKIKDWWQSGFCKDVKNNANLPDMKNYRDFMTELDIINQDDITILELEHTIDKKLGEILSHIYTGGVGI